MVNGHGNDDGDNGYIGGGGDDGDDDDDTWQAWIWRSRGDGDEGMLDGFRKSLQPQNNRMMMDGDIHANEEVDSYFAINLPIIEYTFRNWIWAG